MKNDITKIEFRILIKDGGDVQLLDVKEDAVTVRFIGAFGGCPMASMTLRHGIEQVLKEKVPEVNLKFTEFKVNKDPNCEHCGHSVTKE